MRQHPISRNKLRYLLGRRTSDSGLAEITPCPLNQFSATVFTSLLEENLVPDECFPIPEKETTIGPSWLSGRKRPGMLMVSSSSMTIPILIAKSRIAAKVQKGSLKATSHIPDSALQSAFPNTYLEQGFLQRET
ncbi:hypothetical protein AVEN_194138-1 [Araneus ventricosus]|uniref:Uncharacterized protein n=1 Tax=Araneus ventricosus TaxID=182803 RepID=A0A4Y2SYS1_ARAVE|nr:hypothetical protein AVEN_194138-1 [Araneus ventricosus]